MTRKRRRLYVVLLGLSTLAVAAALVLSAFEDNIVFFYSPTDIATKTPPPDRRVRRPRNRRRLPKPRAKPRAKLSL